MPDNHEKLVQLDDSKLIDIVKNYRQYGYDNELREVAITILAERGINKEDLQITGNLENSTYDFTASLFKSFLQNSKIAFILYLIFLISRVVISILPHDSVGLGSSIIVLTIVVLLLYFVFLIMSFINQSQFYKAFGQDYGTDGALIYFLLGMPLYMFMYFYFRNQMKEKMKELK